MEIRLHLDEHIDPAVAAGLRRRGIDVTTTLEAGLAGADDLEHLQFCLDQQRVIVTQDADYLVLNERGTPHSGIVYSRRGLQSIGELVRGLVVLHAVLTAEEMRNSVEFL